MKRDEFRDLLAGYQYTEEQISDCLSGVEMLETLLESDNRGKTLQTADAGVVPAFCDLLMAQDLNNRGRFVGLYHYAGMIKNYPLQIGVLELVDGFEILGNLHNSIGESLGEEAQARIFDGVDLPQLGSQPIDWTRVNAIVFPRLQQEADASAVRAILRSGLRNLPDKAYLPIKERFESFDDIDTFLEDRGARHLDNLKKHQHEGTPYFNQFINAHVIDFVQATPAIGRGVRQGSTIIEVKIPHQSIDYLTAADATAKQYHVCHCPVVKESIVRNDLTISPAFCDFCPSFNAKPWEVIFGQKLEYEVLESALRGDLWCKFAIQLPLGVV